jgi:RNA polymerase sigma factor (sigma-70 family)
MPGKSRSSSQAFSDDFSLEQLGLDARWYHALNRAGISTVSQLRALSDNELLRIKHIGLTALRDIRRALADVDAKTSPKARGTPMSSSLTEQDVSEEKQVQIIPSTRFDLSLPIEDLNLSIRVKNSFLRGGIATLGGILECDDEKLWGLRNFGQKAFEEVALLRQQWSEQTEQPTGSLHHQHDVGETPTVSDSDPHSRRQAIAQEYGITRTQKDWSWINLLNAGCSWDTLVVFDAALRSNSLPGLNQLPAHTLIGSETVRYLLKIGCPLQSIRVERMALDPTCRRILLAEKLSNVLKVCLADRDQLATVMGDIAPLMRDVTYYVEWLATQSDWKHEIERSQPSPIAFFHLRHTPLSKLVDLALVDLPDRQKQIVKMRFGINQTQDCTLQEVADAVGITRERVRQICSKALKIAKQAIRRDEIIWAFLYYCGELILEAGVTSSAALAREVSEQVAIDLEHPFGAIIFLLETSEKAHWSKSTGLLISPKIPLAKIDTIVASVRYQLTKAKAPMRLMALVEGLDGLSKREHLLPETQQLVRKCLEAASDIINVEEDYWGLSAWESRTLDDTVMVLRKLDRPAHFTEITELVNKRLDKAQQTSAHAVHAKLGHHTDLFVRTGPGTFALRESFPNLPPQPKKYIDLMEEALRAANHPLSVDEIFRWVNERRPAKRSSIVMYLSLSERFTAYGGQTYGLSEWRRSELKAADQTKTSAATLPDEFLQHLKTQTVRKLADDHS